MSFRRINNLTGWAIFAIASFTYLSTMEATASFWDCGEFISSAYKLQIPHPPGAPLFLLITRLFTIPLPPDLVALGVNTMSALSSSFTILFLFWTITHFATKMISKDITGVFTNTQIISIMGAGAVGALAYTFSDSFWYSAVEGEVYAMSSFFTALVFWAGLKWEDEVSIEQANGITGHFTRADRWLILIFYLIGLSVGVHLLCILTIPAIVMIYYFKRYKRTKWGTFWAFVAGGIITGIVQVPMVQWTIKLAGKFDILFVNSFGLPYFYGFSFFFILIAFLIYFTMRMARKNNWNFLKLAMWTFAFVLLGISTYTTTLIRSHADPAIDMFNVDNPVSLVGYLNREQYGDWPILKGPDFTATPSKQEFVPTYIKGNGKYVKEGRKMNVEYDPQDVHIFPRMWDGGNDRGQADFYADFAGIGKDPQTGKYYSTPTMADNISFFISYQFNWMYFRYFMWNFAGKQNDLQGSNMGNIRDGNWLTGIPFWDNARLGDQSKMPDSIKNNKANNKLFALPLILGLLGILYQYKKDKEDLLVVTLLFFFTGIAIVLYLNQAGNQPRERDYAFVGSFYAFAIWIGLGVLYVQELFEKIVKGKMATYLALGLCLLAVPVLMASQEWDDHDRSQKTLARDVAIDYLESCAPNAILITFGDNDTYPLWYAQEVQGVRKDIRVINSSLLGTDWYINQLRYKINESAPVDVIWTKDQILGSKRDAIYFFPDLPGSKVDQSQPFDLYTMMKDYAGSDDPKRMYPNEGEYLNIYPTKNVKLSVDYDKVLKNGTVNANDSVVSEVTFTLPRNAIGKNESAILNIIAANNWERPIYFTSLYKDLGFQEYLRTDGLSYRLVPIKNGEVNADRALDVMMNKFVFGNADKPGVYFDEVNRQSLNTIRMQMGLVANYLADNNRKKDARKILDKVDAGMLQGNMPYAMVSRHQQHNQISGQLLLGAYKAGDTTLAQKISNALRKDLEQQDRYYQSLSERHKYALSYDNQLVQRLLQDLHSMEQFFAGPQPEMDTSIPQSERLPRVDNSMEDTPGQ